MKTINLVLFFIFISTCIVEGQQWEEITPPFEESPFPRTDAAAVYDSVNRQLLIFGGVGDEGYFNDVWAFDISFKRWKNLTPENGDAPEPRYGSSAVFDSQRWQMILYGGRGEDFYTDVWVFHVGDRTWKKLDPTPPEPEPRFCSSAVYDPGADEMILFGGFSTSGRMRDTWKLWTFGESWTNFTTAGGPQSRYRHTAVFNQDNSSMIVYGGRDRYILEDIWSLDLQNGEWTDITPRNSPMGRFSSCGVMDTINERLVIFGGNVGRYELTNETLIFDLSSGNWTESNPGGFLPLEREGACAVYAEQEDAMIIFGGWNEGFLNDVWRFNDLSKINLK